MRPVKKHLRNAVTVLSFLWLLFTFLHLLLTGKIPLWNVPASIPPFFFFLIPLLFLAVEALWKERKRSVMLVGVLSLVLGSTQLDMHWPQSHNKGTGTGSYTRLKVFNWNTQYWDQFKDRKHFYRFLRDQDADIYLLQEYLYTATGADIPANGSTQGFSICTSVPGFPPDYVLPDDTEGLRNEFPGYYLVTDKQFVVLSRFPIKASHCDTSEQYLVSDIAINGRMVRFFNVHMLLHVDPEKLLKPDFYTSLSRRYQARQLGFRRLKEDIAKTETDYFISGDFNSSKAMGVMGDLLKKHVDGVQYSGDLLPTSITFCGMRLWRFDYALIPNTSKTVSFLDYRCIAPEVPSDHNPLSVTLALKDEMPAGQP